MADIHKQAEEWLKAHPKATPEEIWLAGYWHQLITGVTQKDNQTTELWHRKQTLASFLTLQIWNVLSS